MEESRALLVNQVWSVREIGVRIKCNGFHEGKWITRLHFNEMRTAVSIVIIIVSHP